MGRRRGVLVVAALAALVGAIAVAAPATAAEKEPLPVPYGFTTATVHAVTSPYGDPPGADDWDCRPSAEHSDPVVLA